MREYRLGLGSLILAIVAVECVLLSFRDPFLFAPGLLATLFSCYLAGLVLFGDNAYRIFLDDERVPVKRGWRVVRNSVDFKSRVAVNHHRLVAISFDHDLGEQSASGMECLTWLIDTMMDNPNWYPKLREIIFHSGNRVGGENMVQYAKNARMHVPAMREVSVKWLDATVVKGHAKMPKNFNYAARG